MLNMQRNNCIILMSIKESLLISFFFWNSILKYLKFFIKAIVIPDTEIVVFQICIDLHVTSHFIANQIDIIHYCMQYQNLSILFTKPLCPNVMKMSVLCTYKYLSLNILLSFISFILVVTWKTYLDMILFKIRLNASIFVVKYYKRYATICNNCL